MENQTNNMYNPLVKAADADSMLNSMAGWTDMQKDINERATVKPNAKGLYALDYTPQAPGGQSSMVELNGLQLYDRLSNAAANDGNGAADIVHSWYDNPANRLMDAARETAKAAPSVAAVQKDMAEGAGHKNPYDPNSTGGSKSPGVTPTNAPKTSWEALLDTIKKYYGFAKNNIKASGGVMNWLGGNSQTLGGAPRWLVAGGGLAGLLGLGLGTKSLLSKSGSYHPVQGLPMAKLASARAMRAEDPTLLGGVSAGRPDITEGNSIGRMLEIIRTHGNQNAPYGATMPKSAADKDDEDLSEVTTELRHFAPTGDYVKPSILAQAVGMTPEQQVKANWNGLYSSLGMGLGAGVLGGVGAATGGLPGAGVGALGGLLLGKYLAHKAIQSARGLGSEADFRPQYLLPFTGGNEAVMLAGANEKQQDAAVGQGFRQGLASLATHIPFGIGANMLLKDRNMLGAHAVRLAEIPFSTAAQMAVAGK